MKIITIRCAHTAAQTKLRISPDNMCCIQCGLIQATLSHAQATRVRRHCHCMPANLQYERPNNQGRAVITVDPTQVDLRGETIDRWLIG